MKRSRFLGLRGSFLVLGLVFSGLECLESASVLGGLGEAGRGIKEAAQTTKRGAQRLAGRVPGFSRLSDEAKKSQTEFNKLLKISTKTRKNFERVLKQIDSALGSQNLPDASKERLNQNKSTLEDAGNDLAKMYNALNQKAPDIKQALKSLRALKSFERSMKEVKRRQQSLEKAQAKAQGKLSAGNE